MSHASHLARSCDLWLGDSTVRQPGSEDYNLILPLFSPPARAPYWLKPTRDQNPREAIVVVHAGSGPRPGQAGLQGQTEDVLDKGSMI